MKIIIDTISFLFILILTENTKESHAFKQQNWIIKINLKSTSYNEHIQFILFNFLLIEKIYGKDNFLIYLQYVDHLIHLNVMVDSEFMINKKSISLRN